MRSSRAILALALLSSLLPVLPGCDAQRKAEAQAAAETGTPPTPAPGPREARRDRVAPGQPAGKRVDLGAASWVPEDAAFFSSALRLREQWDLIRNSRAVAKLLELPTVQMLITQARQHPALKQFDDQRQNNPFVKAVVDLAADAFSNEVFLYVDSRFADVIDALEAMYRRAFFLGLSDSIDDDFYLGSEGQRQRRDLARRRDFFASVVESAEVLRMPPVVFGFRVSNPREAGETLSALIVNLGRLVPARIVRERIGTGSYYVARFNASMLPPTAVAGISNGLRTDGVPGDIVERIVRLIRSQTLAVSVGLRDDYLLVSVSADTGHLHRFGAGRSLAASPALAPLRKYFKPRMVSLLYVDERLRFPGRKLDAAKIDAGLDGFLRSLPDGVVPQDLPSRLRRDVRDLVGELNQWLPEPLPLVAASFLNDGIESYSFCAHNPGSWDSTKRLSILSVAGKHPLFAFAFRAPPAGTSYDRLGHWTEVVYGYVKDYVLEQMEPSERAHFDEFESVFVESVRELWATTREDLVPSLDGSEGLFLADGDGALRALPGGRAIRFRPPLSFPRPALVVEVKDAQKLKRAFSKYRQIVNEMLRRQAAVDGSLEPLEIPAPQSRSHAGGTLYTYPFPAEVTGDLEMEPHVLVTPQYAVVSLFPSQSSSLVTTATSPSNRSVRLDAPSGAALTIDFQQIFSMIFHDAKISLDRAVAKAELSPQTAHLVRMHLPVAEDLLGTLKSLCARSYREGGLTVRHSWLHVEDLADG